MSDPSTIQADGESRRLEIESLARETAVPVETVHELYEMEHAKLVTQARIKTFVGVLTRRRVKDLLQSQYLPSSIDIVARESRAIGETRTAFQQFTVDTEIAED
jgi:hypothetical protein